MAISGTYDIYNSLFNFKTNSISIQNPQLDFMFKGIVAGKYTNQINKHLSAEINTFMSAFKDQVSGMEEAISTLFGDEEKQFNIETDSETNIIGQVNNEPTISQFSLQVNQLAESQENTSDSFDAEETNTIEAGTRNLQFDLNDNQFDFNFEVKSYENNRTIFNTIADEVNNAAIGINAQVSEDEDGNIALSFQAEETGESNTFTLSGDLADTLNLNQVTREAQNAEYEVDGEVYESENNTITLDNENIKLQLQETTTEPITIEINEDNSTIETEISAFTEQFNEFKTLLRDNSDNKQVDLINKQFNDLSNRFGEVLNDIGIRKRSDGTLEINEEKLRESIADNPDNVRDVFTKTASFGDRLQSRINSIQDLPESVLVDNKITDNSKVTTNNAYTYLNDAQKFNLSLVQSQGTLIDMMF